MVSFGGNVGAFVDGRRGVSSVLGVALMLGFSFAVVGAVVLLGSAAISDLESQASTERAESAFTQLDARAAQVAFGDSKLQTVRLGSLADGEGAVTVDESAGHMTIQSLDPDGTVDDTIMSVDMGAVVYQNGDKTIAYQGAASGGPRTAAAGWSRLPSSTTGTLL